MSPSHMDSSIPKIVFVLPSLAGGGAERVVLNLVRLVDRNSFQPILLLQDASGPLSDKLGDDFPLVSLGRPRLRNALPALVSELRHIRPVCIFSTFTHLNLPLLAVRPLLGGASIIVREANLPSLSLARMPWPGGFRAGCRWLYPTADSVVASSARMRDELLGMKVSNEKICILPNPVDVQSLRRAAEPARRVAGKGLRFVAVGRLVPQKGFDRLIDALAEMPEDCHCTILGEGPERERLILQTRQRGVEDRILFQGFVDNPAPWISGADAFLMPSRFEGMPNSALEALALGTPVIATPEAGGLAEVENVVIAEIGDKFVSAMRATTKKTSHAGSLLPEPFSMESVAKRFNALLTRTQVRSRYGPCSSVI